MDRYETLQPSGVWEIDEGWDVYGADGEKIGDVHDVQSHYLVVSKGFFFPTERYVPVTAITNVENDRVFLNVSKAEIESLGWDEIPSEDAVYAPATTTTTADYDNQPVSGMTTGVGTGSGTHATVSGTPIAPLPQNSGVELGRSSAMTDMTGAGSVTNGMDEPRRVSGSGTGMAVGQVSGGSGEVQTGMIPGGQGLDLPLNLNDVRVERFPVDGAYVSGGVPSYAFEEAEITIPILGEVAQVSKRAAVREHVDISKVILEHNRRFTDTVRREQVYVERDDALASGSGVVTEMQGISSVSENAGVVQERDFRP